MDWKREKLALLEELLGFIERGLVIDAKISPEESYVKTWMPDEKDEARRNELRAQMAELKKELGI